MIAEVALAVSPRSWSHDLHQFVADHGGARVRTRVMSAEEAVSESFDVLIVDDVSSFVTRRLIERVRSTGRFVLGVYDPSEAPEGKQRLLELGVDDVIESGATPDEFLVAIRTLAAERSVPQRTDEGEPAVPGPNGTLVAVGGAASGVGVTEVSVGLAVRLARRRSTLLIDGDDQSPALAQRLGLALHPSIRTALDTFHHGAGDPSSCLQPMTGSSLRVLGGLAGGSDRGELRASDVLDLTQHYLRQEAFVVTNISAGIDGHDFGSTQPRGALARAFLAAADSRVVVADSSPVGLTRLLEWLSRAPIGDRPPHFVLNRAPRSAYRRAEMTHELTEAGVGARIIFTPADHRVSEAAWGGAVLRSGPFVRAIRTLARAIAAETPA